MNTNIRKKTMAAGLAALLMMSGCAGKTPAHTEPSKTASVVKTELKLDQVANQKFDEKKFNDEYGRYSFEMMKQIAEGAEKNCNIMISPASIMMALDMCAAGAARAAGFRIRNDEEIQRFAEDKIRLRKCRLEQRQYPQGQGKSVLYGLYKEDVRSRIQCGQIRSCHS